MRWFLISVFFAGLTGMAIVSANKNKGTNEITKVLKGSYAPVALLELFTSEGCSSCPPADDLLPQLASRDVHIIPLSFHVDYWNRLGWKDPFSNHEFSERQRVYARQFNLESVYTPQLVVNGTYEIVGSNRSKAYVIINRVLKENGLVKLDITGIKVSGTMIHFDVLAEGSIANTDLQAAIIQESVSMLVKAGENRGATLHHTNVVRSFTSKIAASKTSFEMEMPKDIDNWQLIVYAQQKNNLKINGAVLFHP